MPHIGTRAHARKAKEIGDNYWETGGVSDKDWEEVGAGSFRNVFLHKPTGVCYKVDTGYAQDGYVNRYEVKTARRLLRKCLSNDQWINEHVRIPKVSGFTFGDSVVVAMEFIVGTIGRKATTTHEARQALFSLKFGDMHGENYIVDESGTIWPVDLASPRPGSRDYEGPDQRALHERGGW